MKFSVGDKIKLRTTGEEGEVVVNVDNEYYRVRINGVVIPVQESEMDFPYLDWFLKQRAEEKEKKKVFIDNIKVDKSEYSAESLLPPGMYLLFQPVYREQEGEDVINRFVLYLFSEWPKQLNYLVDISIQSENVFSFEGVLKFQQRQLLYSFPFEDASDNPVFNFEILETDEQIAQTHFFNYKLTRKKLIEQVTRLEWDNLPLFEIPVFTQLKPVKKLALPEMGKKATALTILGTPRTRIKAKAEIDLHIEKIEKHHNSLTDGEKLQRQIDYFHTYLDLAMADENINPLRVIHGIGFGVLKKEIFSICDQTFFIQDYVYDKVNPGVTLIYFKN